ncbi:hypothetical protein AV530_001779 [Patagioenas fasciata monilis]|uniref:Uncharacterized protein n=1 Tax=Patagioenas fasciata monilis TaxID=372326 RepID=A0A1V4KMF3_PATFA|nr:hypothetical protein AV530_001779 [Patagioenas fasciata monilis]
MPPKPSLSNGDGTSGFQLTGPAAWHGYRRCPRVSSNDLPLGCECGLYREYPVLARKSAPGCELLQLQHHRGPAMLPGVRGSGLH